MMEDAVRLGKLGFPVFPCLATKAPACPAGFKDAEWEPARVRDLWRRHPGPLIGVATGELSGFDVLDIDPKNGGGRWWEIHAARVPETRIYQTRSGGWHLLFKHHASVRNTQSKIGAGIDTRGEGGYVIWWNASGCPVVSDADIAPWPKWLIGALTAEKPRPIYTAPQTIEARTQRIVTMIENALVKVRTAADGERHYRLRSASYLFGGIIAAGGIGSGEAANALRHAVAAAGAKDMLNAEKTIASGLRIGAARPIDLGGIHDGR